MTNSERARKVRVDFMRVMNKHIDWDSSQSARLMPSDMLEASVLSALNEAVKDFADMGYSLDSNNNGKYWWTECLKKFCNKD